MSGTRKNQVASCELRVAEKSLHPGSALATRYSLLATRRRRPRRGVLLLVVLSLLVLFLMIGTAFIITTKQAEKAAKNLRKHEEERVSEVARGNLLDDVLLQLVRDTDNPNSVLRGSSLLGDLYGNDGFQAQILYDASSNPRAIPQWAKAPSFPEVDANTGMATAGPANGMPGGVTGGQMLQFDIAGASNSYGLPIRLSGLDDAYAGQILTFVSRGALPTNESSIDCRNISTRIVKTRHYQVNNVDRWQFTVMAFNAAGGTLITNPRLIGDARFVVNGRPFNGTGVGLDPTLPPETETAKLIASETDGASSPTTLGPIALLPNPVFFNPANVILSDTTVSPLLYFSDGAGSANVNAYAFAGRSDMPGRGGADESYDAADFQNMFLAAVQDEPEDNQAPGSGTLDRMVLPSFHRPELINYWAARVADAGGDPLVVPTGTNALRLRKVLLRPNHLDHPDFTGSNSGNNDSYEYALTQYKNNPSDLAIQTNLLNKYIYGPWDVDNDNDGNRDSIWIDAGLPIILGPHGRQVKPLVAILVVDMDGRINVNTANTPDVVAQLAPPGTLPVPPNNFVGWQPIVPAPNTGLLANGVSSNSTPRGMGWGPADISTIAALGPGTSALLVTGNDGGGTTIRTFPGRNGRDDAPGRSTRGGPAYIDLMSQVRFFGWPWQSQQLLRTSFGSTPDLRGRYGNGINDYGQLVIQATLASEVTPTSGLVLADSPYETDFFAEGMDSSNGVDASDAPFSLGELERILRTYDTDQTAQPTRLWDLLKDAPTDPAPPDIQEERNRITTESWSVRTPLVSLPHEMDDATFRVMLTPTTPAAIRAQISANPELLRQPRSIAELYEMRVRKALGLTSTATSVHALWPAPLDNTNSTQVERDALRRIMGQILAPELAAGLKLDVNRPLGNGRDDNGNGVVDEPGEDGPSSTPRLPIWQDAASPATAEPLAASLQSAYFNPLAVRYFLPVTIPKVENTANGDFDALLQRQLLARHLYVLALVNSAEAGYTDSTPPATGHEVRARRIAQWAINGVDFRDADATMTPFEFDLNPFDGWDVNGLVGDTMPGPDGILGTTDDVPLPNAQQDDNANFRAVVWGMERPELVMTETMAWHNRNTTDEADEDPNPGESAGDSSDPLNEVGGEFDQRYRPRGAFFMELYNPWSSNPGISPELHRIDANGNDLGVDLALTHDGVPSGTGSPVWRFLVFKDVDPNKDPDADDVSLRPIDLDRSIYLTTTNPHSVDPNDEVEFFRDSAATNNALAPVRPGRFMVIGSGKRIGATGVYQSPLGSLKGPNMTPAQQVGLRRLELDTTPGATATVRLVEDADATAMYRYPIDPALPPAQIPTPFLMETPSEAAAQLPPVIGSTSASIADVAVVDRSVNNAGVEVSRRLTISEPAQGYRNQINNVRFLPQSNDPSEDGEYYYGGNPTQPKAVDTPLDDDPVTGDPLLREIGTKYPYRRIFMQRLANPRAPFHPVMNPYRTVDSTFANITVFNGRNDMEYGVSNSAAMAGFSSVQRGQIQAQRNPDPNPTTPAREFNLWQLELPDVPGTGPTGTIEPPPMATVPTHPNRIRAGMNRGSNSQIFSLMPRLTLGFLNTPFMEPTLADTQASPMKRVQPQSPFPWIAWNDRPFVSGNELLLVPRVQSSQLMAQFSMAFGAHNESPYEQPVVDRLINPAVFTPESSPPYTHLEDLLFDEHPTGSNNQSSHLYRVLEFVQTPSLYAGSSTWLNPRVFGATPVSSPDDPRHAFLPPFNRVSQYREPGRVNLNTIFSPSVYGGLFHAQSDANGVGPQAANPIHPGPQWDMFYTSRRGYSGNGTGTDMLALDKNPLARMAPTFFVNPFRTSGAGNLVPLDAMVQRDGSGEPRNVECTLFRSTDEVADDMDRERLFSGIASGTARVHDDALRNAFFHFSPMTRLDNLTSTQSNVFAVWITIGFFEVERADRSALNFDANHPTLSSEDRDDLFRLVYPDGVMLGKEDGLDEGDVRRLRGFYIIDRSRPAGFLPGQDLNSETTIRLHRRIE